MKKAAARLAPAERRRIGLLWLAAFLLGVPRSLTSTLAGTLFLARVGVEYLPYVYVGTAIAAPLIGLAYLALGQRVSPRTRLVLTFSAVAAVLSVIWGGLRLGVGHWPTIMLAVWCEIEWMLLGLTFWSLANRLFNVRQAKRIFAVVGSGDGVAAIVCGLATDRIVHTLGAEGALLLSIGGVLGGLALLLLVTRSNVPTVASVDEAEAASVVTHHGPKRWRRPEPYVGLIFALGTLSIMTFYVVDNAFNGLAAARFPDEASLAGFLGRFSAAASVLVLVTQLGLAGRLLQRFGVGAGIMALPLLVAAGAALTVGVYGWSGQLAWLFWLGVVTKLGDKLAREACQVPSLLIVYQPLPAEQRDRTQGALEGIVEPVAGGLAGGALLLLQTQLGVGAAGGYALACGLAAVWMVVAWRLARHYPGMLLRALTRPRTSDFELSLRDGTTLGILRRRLASPVPEDVVYALRLLDEADHAELGAEMLPLLASPSDKVRLEVLERLPRWPSESAARQVAALVGSESVPSVKGAALETLGLLGALAGDDATVRLVEDGEGDVRAGALAGLLQQEKTTTLGVQLLRAMAFAPDAARRRTAARVLAKASAAAAADLLPALLADADDDTRKEALRACTEGYASELLPLVERSLMMRETRAVAMHALAAAGDRAVPRLAALAAAAEAPVSVRRAALRGLGLIATRTAAAQLWQLLATGERATMTTALQVWRRHGHHVPEGHDATAVTALILRERDEAAWAQQVAADLGADAQAEGSSGLLARALAHVIEQALARIFLLLGLLYEPAKMDAVHAAFERGGEDARGYALEVLDHLLTSEHLQLLMALLERRFPPVAPATREGRLLELAALGGPRAFPWLTSCAFYAIGEARLGLHPAFAAVLAAARQSPQPVVRETAAWASSIEQAA